MNKKFFSVIIALVTAISLFSGCNRQETPESTTDAGTTASGVTIENPIVHAEEQLSAAKAAKAVGTPKAFGELLCNEKTSLAAYNGPDDIIISADSHTEKTAAIKTVGRVELKSSIYSLVIIDAPGGLCVNARAESIILDGEDITADINNDTGIIYVNGKNTVLNINDGSTDNIFIRNTTAVIYNRTKEDLTVTLTNGDTRTVPGNHTYKVREDLITKGILDS